MPTKTRTARFALIGLEKVENLGLLIIACATVVAGWREGQLMLDHARMLHVAGAVLLLALAVFVIRYGHVKHPCTEDPARAASGDEPPGK